jgi:hypothetical protein
MVALFCLRGPGRGLLLLTGPERFETATRAVLDGERERRLRQIPVQNQPSLFGSLLSVILQAPNTVGEAGIASKLLCF